MSSFLFALLCSFLTYRCGGPATDQASKTTSIRLETVVSGLQSPVHLSAPIGEQIPSLQGHYFYSDYCNGWVRSFKYANGAVTERTVWTALVSCTWFPRTGRFTA